MQHGSGIVSWYVTKLADFLHHWKLSLYKFLNMWKIKQSNCFNRKSVLLKEQFSLNRFHFSLRMRIIFMTLAVMYSNSLTKQTNSFLLSNLWWRAIIASVFMLSISWGEAVTMTNVGWGSHNKPGAFICLETYLNHYHELTWVTCLRNVMCGKSIVISTKELVAIKLFTSLRLKREK